MREIKFRAWDSEYKTMRYDDIHPKDSHWPYDWETSFNVCLQLVEESYTLMQYTCLEDKNGVEIYEGDIIKAKHDDGRYDIGEVVYGSRGAFCLHLPKVATGIKTPLLNYIHGMMFAEYDFEVIGNIYENPELLDKKG